MLPFLVIANVALHLLLPVRGQNNCRRYAERHLLTPKPNYCAKAYLCRQSYQNGYSNYNHGAVDSREHCAGKCCVDVTCVGFQWVVSNKVCLTANGPVTESQVTENANVWLCEKKEGLYVPNTVYTKRNLTVFSSIEPSTKPESLTAEEVDERITAGQAPVVWDLQGLATFNEKLLGDIYIIRFKLMLVHRIEIETASITVLKTKLQYRYDEHRKLAKYMEADTEKIFTFDMTAEKGINITTPFTAQTVRLQVLENPFASVSSVSFQVLFHGYPSMQFQKDHRLIFSNNLDPAIAGDLQFSFPEVYKVSAIMFDRPMFLTEFCIKYKMKDVAYDYKDDKKNGITLFQPTLKRINLRSFLAKTLLLSCLVWKGDVREIFVIYVYGDVSNEADHMWSSMRKAMISSSLNLHSYHDQRGCEPLYGYQVNDGHGGELRSPQIGDDCYTNPGLCDDGFSIRLDLQEPAACGLEHPFAFGQGKKCCKDARSKCPSGDSVPCEYSSCKSRHVKDECPLVGINYSGNNIGTAISAKNWQECNLLCRSENRCKLWTYAISTKGCWLKSGNKVPTNNPNAISGLRNCISDLLIKDGPIVGVDIVTTRATPWKDADTCVTGITGFRLQVESSLGKTGDDASVNGIQFQCKDGTTTGQLLGPFGKWMEEWKTCNQGGHVTTIAAKTYIETQEGGDDQHGVTNVNMTCSGGDIISAVDNAFGDWHGPIGCPLNSFICTVSAKIKPGGDDDVGLFKLKVKCCSVSANVVVSAGLNFYHGYQGTGFNIMASNGIITTVVRTNNMSYIAKANQSLSGSTSSYLLTWKKDDGLKLYVNGELQGSSGGTRDERGVLSTDNAYFGMYQAFSGEFGRLLAWKKHFSSVEVKDMFDIGDKVDLRPSTIASNVGGEIAPNCICVSSVCPCETKISATTANATSSYRSENVKVNEDLSITVYYKDINIPFLYFHLIGASIDIPTSLKLQTCLSVQCAKSSYKTKWCPEGDGWNGKQTVNITLLLKRSLQWKEMNNDKQTKDFTVTMRGFSNTPSKVVQPLTLNMEYQLNIESSQFASISAKEDDSVEKFSISTDSDTKCVSLKLKVFGGGFSFILFTWLDDEETPVEFLRIYSRNLDAGLWKNITIPIGTYKRINVSPIRNGKAAGFVGIRDVSMLRKSCMMEPPSVPRWQTDYFHRMEGIWKGTLWPKVPVVISRDGYVYSLKEGFSGYLRESDRQDYFPSRAGWFIGTRLYGPDSLLYFRITDDEVLEIHRFQPSCTERYKDLENYCALHIFERVRSWETTAIGHSTYGSWSEVAYCAPGVRVRGFRLKVEPKKNDKWYYALKKKTDDSALNGIQLSCEDGTKSTEIIGDAGQWGEFKYCSKGAHVTSFSVHSRPHQGGTYDDYGADNVKMMCSDEKEIIGDDMRFHGSWWTYTHCGPTLYVCGVKARIVADRTEEQYDNTGVNQLMFSCCAGGTNYDAVSAFPRSCLSLYSCQFDRVQLHNNMETIKSILSREECAMRCCMHQKCILFEYNIGSYTCILSKVPLSKTKLTVKANIWACVRTEREAILRNELSQIGFPVPAYLMTVDTWKKNLVGLTLKRREFFQGYDYYTTSASESVPFDMAAVDVFTLILWFKFGDSSLKIKDVFEITNDDDSMPFVIADMKYTFLGAKKKWYHIALQYDGQSAIIFINLKPYIVHHGKVTGNVETMQIQQVVCVQLYKAILDPVLMEQSQLCPNLHSKEACLGKSKCKVCNQLTGEWSFLSTVSSHVKDNCEHRGVPAVTAEQDVKVETTSKPGIPPELAGEWSLSYTNGFKLSYTITIDGLLSWDGKTSRILGSDDESNFPSSQSWKKLEIGNQVSMWEYIRVNEGDGTLEVNHFCSDGDCTTIYKNLKNYCCNGTGIKILEFVGTWEVSYNNERKNLGASYKFSEDGRVTVLQASIANGMLVNQSSLEVSHNTEFPSRDGWRKINKIHKETVHMYVRVKDRRLELIYITANGNKMVGSGTLLLVAGIWKMRYIFPTGNGNAVYNVSEDKSFQILSCDWGDCLKETHSNLEVSSRPAYPSSAGWWKVDTIHRDNAYIFIRVKDLSLEVKYCWTTICDKPHVAFGVRIKSLKPGTWKTTLNNGSTSVYKVNEDRSFEVSSCDWDHCSQETRSILEVSSSTTYPLSAGWWKVNKIHLDKVFIYIRVKDLRLEVRYCTDKSCKPPVFAFGVPEKYKLIPPGLTKVVKIGEVAAGMVGVWNMLFTQLIARNNMEIKADGKVTIPDNKGQYYMQESNDQILFPSSSGWFMVAKFTVHTWEYFRLRSDGTLESRHFCLQANSCSKKYQNVLPFYYGAATGVRQGEQYRAPTTSEYMFGNNLTTWKAAEDVCKNLGARLPIIESQAENDYIMQEMGKRAWRIIWIGYSDQATEGSFVWIHKDGSNNYTNWGTGEPDGKENENCVALRSDGKWVDVRCNSDRPYACEKPIDVLYYYDMDALNHDTAADSKNTPIAVTVNYSVATHVKSLFGSGLCLKNTSTLLTLGTVSGDIMFAFWIKHSCWGDKMLHQILTSSMLTLTCQKSKRGTTMSVNLVYGEVAFTGIANMGLWYHLAIKVEDKLVYFYQNGFLKQSGKLKEGKYTNSAAIKVVAGTCVDEFLVTNAMKPDGEFQDLYRSYFEVNACPEIDIDYVGPNLKTFEKVPDWQACRSLCSNGCYGWTWVSSDSKMVNLRLKCFLKPSNIQRIVNVGLFSGRSNCTGNTMPRDQQMHVTSPYEFSTTVATNYTPSADIKMEEKRLQFMSLNAHVWEEEITNLTKDFKEVALVEFLNQYFYDFERQELRGIFRFYLHHINDKLLGLLENIGGRDVTYGMVPWTIDYPIAACEPLGTGKHCSETPPKPSILSVGCRIPFKEEIEELNFTVTGDNSIYPVSLCAIRSQRKGYVHFALKDKRCFSSSYRHRRPEYGNNTSPSACGTEGTGGKDQYHVYAISGKKENLQCPLSYPYAFANGRGCCDSYTPDSSDGYPDISVYQETCSKSLDCIHSPCADFNPGMIDSFFQIALASMWTTFHYIEVDQRSQTIKFTEMNADYAMYPMASPTSYYIQFSTNPADSKQKIAFSTEVAISGVLPQVRYDVCISPMQSGDKPISYNFCPKNDEATYRCMLVSGDGGGGIEVKMGTMSNDDCIKACIDRKRKNGRINGVTVLSNSNQRGKDNNCWCEMGMNKVEESPLYKTCFLNAEAIPATPTVHSCNTSCGMKQVGDMLLPESNIICNISTAQSTNLDKQIRFYEVYAGLKSLIWNCLVASGCDVNTWPLSGFHKIKVVNTTLHEFVVSFPAPGKYLKYAIAARAYDENFGYLGSGGHRSCPAVPDYAPQEFAVSVEVENFRIKCSWLPLTLDTEWNDDPLTGTYKVYYNNITLDMLQEESLDSPKTVKDGISSNTSMSLDVIDDDVSCLHAFKVVAVSIGDGPPSPPICVVVSKQAPLVTANITFIRLIKISSAELSVHSISAGSFCGSNKSVVITAVDMYMAFIQLGMTLQNTTSLMNISVTAVAKKGNLTEEEGKYLVYGTRSFTFDNTFSQESTCACLATNSSSCNDLKAYLSQVASFNYTLRNLTYYRNYSIMSHLCNSFGCGDASVPIVFQTGEYIPSCPPVNLTVENTTSTSIVLVWENVPRICANGRITSFNIGLNRTRYGTRVEKNATARWVEMLHLEPYELYCAEVSGSTYVGMGPYSDPICVYTNEDAHESVPQVELARTNRSSIDITIVPTDRYDLNGVLQNIIMYYQDVAVYNRTNGSYIPFSIRNGVLRALNTSGFVQKKFSMDHAWFFNGNNSAEHQIHVGGLMAYTFYAFQLAYQTNHSVGNKTKTYVVRTKEGVPVMAPFNVSGIGNDAYSINVTWHSVPIASRRGIIKGYWLYYSKVFEHNNSLGLSMTVHINNSDINQITLEDLERDSEYNITLAAYSSAGTGAKSFPVKVETGKYHDGNFTEWSAWTLCSKSCDEGLHNRTRNCTNPAPWNGGYDCKGNYTEIRSCEIRPCEVNGTWTEWNEWSFCTVTCGGGTTYRKRKCVLDRRVSPGVSIVCDGMKDEEQDKACKENFCAGPIALKPGNANCTFGCHKRGFSCESNLTTGNTTQIFNDAGLNCSSDVSRANWAKAYHPLYHPWNKQCIGYKNVPQPIKCVLDATTSKIIKGAQRICDCFDPNERLFTAWARWSVCSSWCTSEEKPGFQTRRRKCKLEDPDDCIGEFQMHKPCDDVPLCPIDGVWGAWSPVSKCNKTCGYGYQHRTRKCDDPAPKAGGINCTGIDVHIIPECNAFPCPQHGGVGNWSEWSISEEPCGVSNATRRRSCNNPPVKYRGKPCKEHLIEYKKVEMPPCKRLNVEYAMKFLDEKWDYTMYYGEREKATALKKKIEEKVIAVHEILNITIGSVAFNELRRGSVIANFSIEYAAVNRDQIVTFNADVRTEGLQGMRVGEDIHIRIPSIPCPPPTNITYTTVDPFTIELNWEVPPCNQSGTRAYLYHRKVDLLNQRRYLWSVWGKEANDSKNSLYVPNLEQAAVYEGYLVYSMIAVGNGPPSKFFKFRTTIDAPSQPPEVVSGISNAPTKITVDWSKLPKSLWGGELLGYKIRYKRFLDTDFSVKIINPGYQTSTLTKLTPYTLYWIELCGYNSAGDGPPGYDTVKTQQGAPSIVVPNIQMWTKQDISWWAVSWGQIDQRFVHGILLGYRITYYMSYRSGVLLGGDLMPTIVDVDSLTYFLKVTGLVPYARYDVTVAGFTIAGEGPSEIKVADTCNCDRTLFFNWYDKHPYVYLNPSNGRVNGTFPRMIEKILLEVCGTCRSHKAPKFYYFQSRTGEDPRKRNEHELKRDMSRSIDVSFPVYGQTGRTYPDVSTFILIVKSTGCSLVVRGGLDKKQELEAMIAGIIQVWPLILITYAIAAVAGTVVWLIEQHDENEDFVTTSTKPGFLRAIGNALKGLGTGFWWSFVTMTTMGYGDKVNQSVVGRIIALIWFLTGLVLNGILIGSITSSLTILGQAIDPVLYNTRTAAIYTSFEYFYAIRKNAIVDPDKRYFTIISMLDALQNEEVDIVMLDTFALARLGETLQKKNLKIAEMINTDSGYGIVLGGSARVLEPDIRSQILVRESQITEFISSFKDDIPEMEKAETGEGQDDMFSGDSYGFQLSMQWIFIIIAILTFFGIIYEIHRYKRMRRKIGYEESNITRLYNLQEMVDDFKSNLSQAMEEMEEKHMEERVRLFIIKKGYKAMVALEGKEVVDRRLRISEMQARRYAMARGLPFSDIEHKPGDYHRPGARIDSTMLY